ncbi:hypothetical protein Q8W71_16075 [Methylobacterium sp. NEAU 140]|uniref:hypothetical protein n=1 Tax=Methylobacterium sp. NEAU 140 TaxID=3064945 RepID=UPI00273686FC|nr:hypothetical protein [Methylobacterium sp. NEAU 140]MDP4024147.1 hypothetical protein [Methylobacterium sp. NEAU 140]
MPIKLKRALIGAVVTVALAAAVSYGLIGQETADKLQTQVNQTLSEGQNPPASGQPGTGTPVPQNPDPQAAPTEQRSPAPAR